MIDKNVSLSSFIANAMWAITLVLVGAAWILDAMRQWDVDVAILLGFTACPFSAYAAVRTIRCYSIRLANLIRLAHGLDPDDVQRHMGTNLRPLR